MYLRTKIREITSWQKFRETNIFTKEFTKELISRNIFCQFHGKIVQICSKCNPKL